MTTPPLMRAIRVTSTGGPSALSMALIPTPAPADGEVLIRVLAAGVAFPELLLSRGEYQHRPPLPFTPGNEVAGTVVCAPQGSGFEPGQRVAAVVVQGYCEYTTAPAHQVFPIPDDLPFESAAALPLNYLTAYFGLVDRAGLRPGEAVLVHGASGGLGAAAMQIAKAFGAGQVLAVTSTRERGEFAVAAGGDDFVLASEFKDRTLERGGADLVVDPVGGDRFTDSLRCLRPFGRILVLGFAGGSIPTVKVNRLLLNNIGVLGVEWGFNAMKHPGLARAQWDAIAPFIASGAVHPPVSSVRPLDQAPAALADIENRAVVGKIVLCP